MEHAEFDGEILYLESDAVITDSDLRNVRASSRGDRLLVELELTPAAARQVQAVTRLHVGKRMAFLVDSEVRSAPVIASAVSSPLQAAIEVGESEQERILERIRARWPQPEK
jgi:preprotein translocase subunit SecD